jgi:Terpene synthase family 2, C-terminal metal binding
MPDSFSFESKPAAGLLETVPPEPHTGAPQMSDVIESLPSLHYPFEDHISARRNPYEQDIEDVISGWIDDQYLFLSAAERDYYKKCRFGMITSCFYPNANYQALALGARLTVLLFIHDDYTDNFSPDELRSFVLQSESIMAGHLIPYKDGDILHQFVLLREELQSLVTAGWMQRWNSHLNYFYEGMISERYFMHAANRYPSIQHYMFVREHLIGMYIFQDIVELYMPSLLPYSVVSHPYTRQLRRVAARIIAWCNDYYSAEKELNACQTMNLVLVIKHERQCGLEEAYAEAMRIHDEEVEKFMHLMNNTPDVGHHNDLLKEYAHNLQLMFRGNQLWHIRSGRYNKV